MFDEYSAGEYTKSSCSTKKIATYRRSFSSCQNDTGSTEAEVSFAFEAVDEYQCTLIGSLGNNVVHVLHVEKCYFGLKSTHCAHFSMES